MSIHTDQATADRWIAAGQWVEFAEGGPGCDGGYQCPAERHSLGCYAGSADDPDDWSLNNPQPPADWAEPAPCETCEGYGFIVLETGERYVSRPCLCSGGPGPYGERPCSRCGGSGVEHYEQDPREQHPCPDCRDGRPILTIEVGLPHLGEWVTCRFTAREVLPIVEDCEDISSAYWGPACIEFSRGVSAHRLIPKWDGVLEYNDCSDTELPPAVVPGQFALLGEVVR